MPPLPRLAALGVLAALAAACDRAPSAEHLSPWTPADHDQEPNQPSPNQGAKGDGGAGVTLAELTWQKQCATCHGMSGHGDGPQAAMFKPPDLGSEPVQKLSDAEIASVIQNGKGRMPKFDLSDDVVNGLVARVRSVRGQ